MATRAVKKSKLTENVNVEAPIKKPVVPKIVEEDEIYDDSDLDTSDEDIEENENSDESAPKKRGRKSKEEMSCFSITVDRKVYRVSSDRYCWTLSIRKKTSNKDNPYVWFPILYAGNFIQIMTALRAEAISTSSYKKLSELIANIKCINDEIKGFLLEIESTLPKSEYENIAKKLIEELKIAAQ